MKRFLILCMILGLIAGGATTAEAQQQAPNKHGKRTVEGTYTVYPAPLTGCNSPLGTWACLIVDAKPTEAFLTAKVADAHGRPVYVEVRTQGRVLATFCGETTRPINFYPGSSLEFDIGLSRYVVSDDCPTNMVKTTGTIRVTLSNRR